MSTIRCERCYGGGTVGMGSPCALCKGTGRIEIPDTSAAELQIAHAQRDAALDALDNIEAMISRIGGCYSPEDQAITRNARAVLEEQGRRKSDGRFAARRPEWANGSGNGHGKR